MPDHDYEHKKIDESLSKLSESVTDLKVSFAEMRGRLISSASLGSILGGGVITAIAELVIR